MGTLVGVSVALTVIMLAVGAIFFFRQGKESADYDSINKSLKEKRDQERVASASADAKYRGRDGLTERMSKYTKK